MRTAGVAFQPEAANKLISDLSLTWVQDSQGGQTQQIGDEIEPVHLQLVCHRLWEKKKNADAITLDDVEDGKSRAEGNAVDIALADYYAGQVQAAAEDGKEVVVRQWIEKNLILGSVRNQIPEGQGTTAGLSNEVIKKLTEAYLVTRDPRRDAVWLELAHDRLIKPILENNAVWFRQHHSALQRQAALWDERGRPDSLCLSGDELYAARKWAEAHTDEVREVDDKFLQRCLRLRDRTKRFFYYRLATAAVIFSLCTGALAWWAIKEAQRANKETKRATAEEKLASSRGIAAQALAIWSRRLIWQCCSQSKRNAARRLRKRVAV